MAKKQKATEPTTTEGPKTQAAKHAPDSRSQKKTPPTGGVNDAAKDPATPTLADAFVGYLKSLEDEGKSIGTIASYRAELVMAGNALGVDTPAAAVTPELVLAFFTSDLVMRKRNGRAKSPLSIDKTRRVLRQALVWAETAGMVKVAPVPELLATH